MQLDELQSLDATEAAPVRTRGSNTTPRHSLAKHIASVPFFIGVRRFKRRPR